MRQTACIEVDIRRRELWKLSHTRVPKEEFVSVGKAKQAVTSTNNIACYVMELKVWSSEKGIKAGVFNEIRIVVVVMQCVDLLVIS